MVRYMYIGLANFMNQIYVLLKRRSIYLKIEKDSKYCLETFNSKPKKYIWTQYVNYIINLLSLLFFTVYLH